MSQSWHTLLALLKPFAVGAVIVSAILLLSQFQLQHKTMSVMGGNNPERMMELSERVARGDESAMMEMLQDMGMNNIEEGITEEEAGMMMTKHLLKNMAPVMGSFAILLIIVTMLAKAYYLVVATDETLDIGVAVKRTFGFIFPLIGLSIWMFLRSFAWIPIIGIVTAIVIGPRLAFAPLIYLREGGGVIGATRASYARTAGHWGRIVGYMLLLAFSLFLAMIFIGLVGKTLMILPMVSVVVVAVAYQFLLCFGSVFYVQFGTDILSHPFTVTAAPVRAFASSPVVRKPVMSAPKKAPVKKPPTKKAAPKKKPAAQKAKSVTKKKAVAKKKK